MRFLALTHGDGKNEVSGIIGSKYEPCKTILTRELDNILDRIDAFNSTKDDCVFPSPVTWMTDAKKCMIGMYKSKTEDLALVKSKVKAALRGIDSKLLCPYCGTATADCHDHFLDKDTYPEYSAVPDNLIYVCDKCNTLKKQKGERAATNIIWSYYVLSQEYVFLQCHLRWIAGVITPIFSIVEHHSRIPVRILKRIQLHFCELDLAERYLAQSQTETAFFVEEYQRRIGNKVKLLDLMDIYQSRARKYTAEHHPNHHHTILCSALTSQVPGLFR